MPIKAFVEETEEKRQGYLTNRMSLFFLHKNMAEEKTTFDIQIVVRKAQ